MTTAVQPLDELWRELGAVLAEQEHALERLLFKLEQEHLLLVTRRVRWMRQSTEEVLTVGKQLEELDGRRRAAVDRIAVAVGLPASATLTELLAHAPEAWASVLTEHRRLMRRGVEQVQDITRRNRQVITERLATAPGGGPANGYGGDAPRSGGYLTGAI